MATSINAAAKELEETRSEVKRLDDRTKRLAIRERATRDRVIELEAFVELMKYWFVSTDDTLKDYEKRFDFIERALIIFGIMQMFTIAAVIAIIKWY